MHLDHLQPTSIIVIFRIENRDEFFAPLCSSVIEESIGAKIEKFPKIAFLKFLSQK